MNWFQMENEALQRQGQAKEAGKRDRLLKQLELDDKRPSLLEQWAARLRRWSQDRKADQEDNKARPALNM